MSRDRIISGDAVAGDELPDEFGGNALRPKTLEEYVGQRGVVEPLRVALQAARQRAEALDHTLFHGPPGLGKTTLARIIQQQMGTEIIMTSGPALKRPGDLIGLLTNLKQGDIFFVDEIHRLDRAVEEYLYPAMEDFAVDFVLDRGANARILNLPLKRFTMVGATTMAGMLSGPLRDRFGLVYRMSYYSAEELKQIVLRSAEILEVAIEDAGAEEIARRSRGTPRIANRLLRRVRDYAQVHADGTITRPMADEALRLEQIDALGLDQLDRALLRVIIEVYQGGPVGIEALGATLSEATSTLVEVVEPYLLQIGFLARTPTGRIATHRAYAHLGYDQPPGSGPAGPQGRLNF
jgi:holliday junction DNA helicase RuvB